MDWFFYALLSAVFFSISRVISRFLLKEKGNPLAYLVVHNFATASVLLVVAFVLGDYKFPSSVLDWLFITIGILVFGIGDFFSFRAIKETPISLFQIITQMRQVFVLVGAFIIYQEGITLPKIGAIALIILGTFITLYEKSKLYWTTGIMYSLLTGFFYSIAYLMEKSYLSKISLPFYAFLDFFLIAVFWAIVLLIRGKSKIIKKEMKMQGYKIFIAGFFFAFFKLFMTLSIISGEVSKAVAVAQSALVFTVLAGIVLLKEHDRIANKLIGIAVMIAGFVVLYLY